MNEVEQQAAQAFADSIDWWKDCPGVPGSLVGEGTNPVGPFTHHVGCLCRCTRKVLRYPHLFEAMHRLCEYSKMSYGGKAYCNGGKLYLLGGARECPVCKGIGYIVRPVVEIWWRLIMGPLEEEGFTLNVSTDGHVHLYNRKWQVAVETRQYNQPILATFAALEKAIGRKS